MSSIVSHLFIHNNSFIGVMKTSIVKEFHDVFLKVEFHRILSTEKQLIEMVAKGCWESHTNVEALKLVSTEMIYSKMFNYNDAEQFSKYLSFCRNRDVIVDEQQGANWTIEFTFYNDVHHFKVVMSTREVKRLFTQVYSFYSNYFVFAAINKSSDNQETKVETNGKKITDYIETRSTDVTPVIDSIPEVVKEVQVAKERTELDDIFELCLSSSLKSAVIHYVFNYFRYFTTDHCKIDVSDSKQVRYTVPPILPNDFTMDEKYFSSLILSNTTISFDSVVYVIKKIFHNLLNNYDKYKESPIYIMMLMNLLFIYLLRYLYDSNRETFRGYFSRFIREPNVQHLLFEKLISSNFQEFQGKLYFRIIQPDFSELENKEHYDTVEKISKDYKHLIAVSQEQFVESVLSELHSKESKTITLPQNFKLTEKKVIDISKIMEYEQIQPKKNSVMFDPEQTLSPIDIHDLDYLNYSNLSNNGERIITKAYQHLVNYTKNPSSILLIDDKSMPKEVLNMFDVLSTKILNAGIILKDDSSTLNYYNILLNNLPNAQSFKHTVLLYIIFQIMIPYHYDVYGNSQFHDCLL